MEMHVTNFKKRFGICKMQGKGYVDGKVSKRPVCVPFAAAASRFLLALELAAARQLEPVSTNSLPWMSLARHCSNVLPPPFSTRAAISRASAYSLIRLIQVAVEGDFTFAIVQEKKE